MLEQSLFTWSLLIDIMQQQPADPMMLLLVQIIVSVVIAGIVIDQLRRWLLRRQPQPRRARRRTRRALQSPSVRGSTPRIRATSARSAKSNVPILARRVYASLAQQQTPRATIERLRQMGMEQEQELWDTQEQLVTTRDELSGALAQIAELERKVIQATAKRLPTVTLDAIANATTILIVGSRGSGKTTLLQAMLQRRTDALYIFDPHAAVQKWPEDAIVTGGGRDFAAIYKKLVWAYDAMDARSKQQAGQPEGAIAFPPFSLASDEWGSVIANLAKEDRKPGALTLDLLKEGRKFKIGFAASAHGDSVKSVLGVEGDYAAFINSFDWIIYLGAFVSDKLKSYPEILQELPWGRNKDGISFPLVVAAYQPTTRAYALLDMRGIDAPRLIRPQHSQEQKHVISAEQLLKRTLVGIEERHRQEDNVHAHSTHAPTLPAEEKARPKIKRRAEIRDAALSELTLAQQEGRKPSRGAVSRAVFRRDDGPYRQQVNQVIEEEELWPITNRND